MDFTIITPSLNYGRFLGDCLKSVAEQEGVTFEHLVIDGGSSGRQRGNCGTFSTRCLVAGTGQGHVRCDQQGL